MSRREEYQAKLKANLATLEAEIDKLSAKANKAKSDAQVKLDMELAVLKAQQQVAKARFTALKRASDGSCPLTWCRSGVPGQRLLLGQAAATGGSLTMGSSLMGAIVSRLM